jgi:hypothetical protein
MYVRSWVLAYRIGLSFLLFCFFRWARGLWLPMMSFTAVPPVGERKAWALLNPGRKTKCRGGGYSIAVGQGPSNGGMDFLFCIF